MKSHQVKILANNKVSDRYWHMTVDMSGIEEKVAPGQFFNIRCTDGVFPFLRRPLSVYRINEEQQLLEFLYLVKGSGTRKMTELTAADNLDIMGPLGTGFTIEKNDKSILLLARGVGIATLAALAYEAVSNHVQVIAILSARNENDLLAADYLEKLGAKVYKVTDAASTSDVENVECIISEVMKENNVTTFYTCGSKRLAKLMQAIANEHGIRGEMALEEHMGCAMGVCFACVCDINEGNKTKSVRVCLEGPVFPLEKVVLK